MTQGINTNETNGQTEKQKIMQHEEMNKEQESLSAGTLPLSKKQIQFPQAINIIMSVGAGLFLMYFLQNIIISVISLTANLGDIMLYKNGPTIFNVFTILNIIIIIGYAILISMVSVKALRVQYAATRTAAILILVSLGISIVVLIFRTAINGVYDVPGFIRIISRILTIVDVCMKTVGTIFALSTYIQYAIDATIIKKVFYASLVLFGLYTILLFINLLTHTLKIADIGIYIYTFVFSMILWRVYKLRIITPIVLSWVAVGLNIVSSITLLMFAVAKYGMTLLYEVEASKSIVTDYILLMDVGFFWNFYLEMNVVMTICFVAILICSTAFTVRRSK